MITATNSTALLDRRAATTATGTVQLIGVPMDLGASRRGVDMGPSAMRLSSLTELLQRLGLSVGRSVHLLVKAHAVLTIA